MKNQHTLAQTTKNEIVVYQPNETMRLEVLVENESVWLTQARLGDLFGVDRSVINRHIHNIYGSPYESVGEGDHGSARKGEGPEVVVERDPDGHFNRNRPLIIVRPIVRQFGHERAFDTTVMFHGYGQTA